MKCDACGAPVVNGKCTYCGKVFPDRGTNTNAPQQGQTTVNVNINSNPTPVYNVPVQRQKKKFGCGTFLLIAIGLILILSLFGKSGSSSSKEGDTIWATSSTPIEQFDYYLDGDYVYLTDYEGHDKKIKIGTTYRIEGKEYRVAPKLEDLFAIGNVYSVIIPEGIEQMENNIFNSCGVKYVYIPKSLQPDGSSYSFYRYFHDVEKIYYGGSKEEWAILTDNAERSKIDAKEIIYDANIEDLNF